MSLFKAVLVEHGYHNSSHEREIIETDAPIRKHPRIILTDHMAWYSEEAQVELQSSAAKVIVQVCTGGIPSSLANPRVLQKMGRYKEWNPAPSMIWQLKRPGLPMPQG